MTDEREWRSVNGWKDTARQYAVNADYWRECAETWKADADRLAAASRFICDNYALAINPLSAALAAHDALAAETETPA